MTGPARLMLERIERGARDPKHSSILILHDGESRPDALLQFATAFGDRHVVLPRAPRWAAFRGPGVFSWFNSPGDGTIDPVTYGDSLCQLELLLPTMEVGNAQGVGGIGFGQGATMLAGLAALWPEKFAWIALVDGTWPDWLDPLIPFRSMHDLPLLVVGRERGALFDASSLTARCARVERSGAGVEAIPPWVASFARAWELTA